MEQNLGEKAHIADAEADEQIDAVLIKGIFAFRAQKLLKENQALLEREEFIQVIDNANKIFAIIERERELSVTDDISTLLAWIKNIIRAANENFVNINHIKEKIRSLEVSLKEGRMVALRKELIQLMANLDDHYLAYFQSWSRYTVVELNDMMDDLVDHYVEVPDLFKDFQENPIHILTSYLEDILGHLEDEDHKALETMIRRFYILYFQAHRFVAEEQKSRDPNAPECTTNKVWDIFQALKEIDRVEEDVKLGPVLDDVNLRDVGKLEEDGPAPGEELPGLDEEELSVIEVPMDAGNVGSHQMKSEVQKASEITHGEDEEELTVIELPELQPLATIGGAGELDTIREEKMRMSLEVSDALEKMCFAGTEPEEEPIRKKGKKPEASEMPRSSGDKSSKKKKIIKKVFDQGKIKIHIRKKAKKKGKKLPEYVPPEDTDEITIVKRRAKKSSEQVHSSLIDESSKKNKKGKLVKHQGLGGKTVVDMIEIEANEDHTEEEALRIELLKLDSLAFKSYLNGDFEAAIEHYDRILKLDPDYKDAYVKRDECYMRVLKGMRINYTRSVFAKGPKEKEEKVQTLAEIVEELDKKTG